VRLDIVEQQQQSTSSTAGSQPQLDLLIDWEHGWNRPKPWYGAAGSFIAHVFLILGFLALPERDFADPVSAPQVVDVRKSIPLVAPQDLLTQKAPNVNQPAKQLDLAGLVARPDVKPSAPSKPAARPFSAPPAPKAQAPAPTPARPLEIEAAPKIAQNLPPALGNNPTTTQTPIAPPPPPPPTETKPKLAFETPGVVTGAPKGQIEAPKQMTMADAARNPVVRGVTGGVVVGDLGADPTPGLPNVPGTQGKTGNSLELLSDPMGVDFRPYLVRVLAAVRRNWFAVMPESARMGMRGRAVIQFAIAKNGSVPKLIIHTPSGSEHLDRAAVAGISASNPFPPLPDEFRGNQIRLQLVFAYNLPR